MIITITIQLQIPWKHFFPYLRLKSPCFSVNYRISLTWIVSAIWKWVTYKTHDSQWRRTVRSQHNLPRLYPIFPTVRAIYQVELVIHGTIHSKPLDSLVKSPCLRRKTNNIFPGNSSHAMTRRIPGGQNPRPRAAGVQWNGCFWWWFNHKKTGEQKPHPWSTTPAFRLCFEWSYILWIRHAFWLSILMKSWFCCSGPTKN